MHDHVASRSVEALDAASDTTFKPLEMIHRLPHVMMAHVTPRAESSKSTVTDEDERIRCN